LIDENSHRTVEIAFSHAPTYRMPRIAINYSAIAPAYLRTVCRSTPKDFATL
jgi:hypothetical protein